MLMPAVERVPAAGIRSFDQQLIEGPTNKNINPYQLVLKQCQIMTFTSLGSRYDLRTDPDLEARTEPGRRARTRSARYGAG